MAKQMVGPLERHLEKAILAIAGVLLIGSAAVYLVSSPNEIELGGESVTPKTIDAKLANRATSVRATIRGAPSDSSDIELLAPGFASKLDPFRGGGISLTLVSAGAIGPHVPVADHASAAPGQRSLVTVAPLGRPSATGGRSTFAFLDENGDDDFSIANWVTLSAVFDVEEQTALQKAEYGASRKDVFWGPAQLQRRSQRADATWSDDDWQDIEPWPANTLGPPPGISLIDEGDVVSVDQASRVRLDRYVDDLVVPEQQMRALRPLLYAIENGDGWSFPILTDYRDVVLQDQEFLFPEDPSADRYDRYGTEEGEVQIDLGGGQEAITFADRKKLHEEAYSRLLDSAQKNQDSEDAIRAYNEAQAIFTDLEANAGDRAQATKMMKSAEEQQFDIERRLKRKRRSPVRGAAHGQVAREPVRQAQPTQQMWCHDAGPGSVESGKTYQYRMRPTILNGFVGEPQKFRDKQNAALVLIAGAWTEPVEVSIPLDTMFFLTSKDKGKGTAKFQFYKWEEGVWVESRRFAYSVGDDLKCQSRCRLPSPDDPSSSYNGLVDFEIDGTIVDIDFDRTYRERKKVSGSKEGVKFADASKACSVVFVDAFGRLQERFVKTDKTNPERKIVKQNVYPKK